MASACSGVVVVRARQLLHILSRQWQAVVHLAIISSTKWDQIARSRRGMLAGAGEVNGWKLSVEREWGTRGYSRRKLTHLRVLRSSAPLFFLASPWEEKSWRVQGAELLSENSECRGETHVTTMVTFRPGECCFSVGGAQAWNTLAMFVSGVQGKERVAG